MPLNWMHNHHGEYQVKVHGHDKAKGPSEPIFGHQIRHQHRESNGSNATHGLVRTHHGRPLFSEVTVESCEAYGDHYSESCAWN